MDDMPTIPLIIRNEHKTAYKECGEFSRSYKMYSA